jgi:hypothetical protein
LHAVGDDVPTLTGGDGEHDPGTADLIPGGGITPGDLSQDEVVAGREGQGVGLSTTHEAVSHAGEGT